MHVSECTCQDRQTDGWTDGAASACPQNQLLWQPLVVVAKAARTNHKQWKLNETTSSVLLFGILLNTRGVMAPMAARATLLTASLPSCYANCLAAMLTGSLPPCLCFHQSIL